MAPDALCAGLLPVIPDREDAPAVFARSGEALWTRREFRAHLLDWAGDLVAPAPSLVFLLCQNGPDSLAALYGAIAAGHAVALLDAGVSESGLVALAAAFQPDFIISPRPFALEGFAARRPGTGPTVLTSVHAAPRSPLADGLSVLLSTSGTTGSQKFVRLAARNLVANADQIASALRMTADDVGVAHLPFHYSYGLSVVTSHLRIGAALHLWDDSVTIPEFWESVGRSGGTQFPGVPFHYNFLARGDLSKVVPVSMRTFTQAGGALAPRLQSRMHEMTSALGAAFYVMYGQTEASPRMATLPPERLQEKLGSVGPALPGGRFSIVGEDGAPAPPGSAGLVVYEGPNVMLGYAERRTDLALGDVMGGRLETGDLGSLDAEGYLTLTGRAKRFAKLHGLRLSLEEVEARFRDAAEVAAIERGDKILLFTASPESVSALVPTVAAEYKVMSSNFGVRPVPDLPRKASGKVDYGALEALK